jgi:ABC-2 type transport system permease protein
VTPQRLAVRLVRRGTVILVYVSAAITVVGVTTFHSTYPTAASRATLVTLVGDNRAFAALQGQAVAIGTPGGFLVWKYGGTLVVVIAIWSLLTVTRLLRGDEERGRTDLLVAAPTKLMQMVGGQLAVAAGAVTLVGLAAALGAAAKGLPLEGSFLFGFQMASGGWVFGGVAAVASQLMPTRRQASGLAGVALVAAFLLRAVATGSGRYWLCWLTPFGWADRLSPFSHPRLLSVVLVIVATLALPAAALWLRTRRDTGEGNVVVHDRARAQTGSLGSLLGLEWRLTRGTAFSWGAGAVVAGFTLGFLASGVADYAQRDRNVNHIITKATGTSVASVTGFVGLSFSIVAIVLAIFAGTLITRTRDEEASGRADLLLVSGTSRSGFMGSRLASGAALVLALALLAAVATWSGTAVSGSAGAWGGLLKGGLNIVPLVLLFGGLAVLVYGLRPRATGATAFALVGVAYGIQVIGGSVKAPQWLLDVSPFTHLAPVPAVPFDGESAGVMAGLALVAALVGVLAFARRDTAAA